jgi:hypothetical protein
LELVKGRKLNKLDILILKKKLLNSLPEHFPVIDKESNL